jgi:hypothetical protein
MPYTRYKVSVRAENHAGNSEFGPEAIFRTLGEAPKHAPSIQSVKNGTSGCVDVSWRNSPLDQVGKPIVGYRIMVIITKFTQLKSKLLRFIGLEQLQCANGM